MKGKAGTIGLEIHAYLTTREKLFCRCRASREKGLKKNVNICEICTGQPGAKPMLPNKDAIEKAVKIGLMLNCKINEKVFWQRKHYDWPDLPKGYQDTISGSHSVPLGEKGKFSGIRIRSMHLEEDPASWDPKTGCVDYNRSGLPLVEIVTEPDFSFSEEVYGWMKKLVHLLSYLKAVDKNAGIKTDVNVNIPEKTERVEIKNINSLENVRRAIDFELERQKKEGSVRETRRFDEMKNRTIRMRQKEEQDDYRFISDPDLQEIYISKESIERLEKNLPEYPEEKLGRMIRELKIDKKNAEILTKNLDIALFFEEVSEKIDPGFALPWINVELLRVLNWSRKELSDVEIEPEHFIKLLELVRKGKITELQAKQILNKFVPKSFDPSRMEGKITDKQEIRKIAEKVIGKNKKAAESYKQGNKKALNFFMGAIMKETERRADYRISLKVLEEMLES